jgi:hypothetical protein
VVTAPALGALLDVTAWISAWGVPSSATHDHFHDLPLGDRADGARAWLLGHAVEAILGDAPSELEATRAARDGPSP